MKQRTDVVRQAYRFALDPTPSQERALLRHAGARRWAGEEAAKQWLCSPNSYLEEARPLDVLHHRGPSAMLDALDAEMWGGAA